MCLLGLPASGDPLAEVSEHLDLTLPGVTIAISLVQRGPHRGVG